MNSKISFIVPIYNIEDLLLQQCIDSILKQKSDLYDIEVLLIDDGSIESNGKICDEYAEKNQEIKCFHEINRGVSVARNIGIENATGNYICFVDPDDRLIPNFTCKVYEQVVLHQADIICYKLITDKDYNPCNYKSMDKDVVFGPLSQQEVDSVYQDIICLATGNYNLGACWGKLIRRDFLNENNIRFVPGLKKAQDRVFMLDCLEKYPRTYQYDAIGYVYTVGNLSSICHKFNPNIFSILESTAEQIKKRIDKFEGKYLDAYYCMNMMFFYEYMQLYYCHPNCTLDKSKLIKEIKQKLSEQPYRDSLKKANVKLVRKKCAAMIWLFRLGLHSIAMKLV